MTERSSITPFAEEKALLMFPRLTAEQLERVLKRGRRRQVPAGEVLGESGVPQVPLFVVLSGEVDVLRPGKGTVNFVATQGPGQFTGEANLLSGRRSLNRLVMSDAGEVIEVSREELLRIVQTDPEIGELMLKAFIYRRIALIDHELGDAVVIGSIYSAATLAIREFLSRNGHPYSYLDLDRDGDIQALFDRFDVGPDDIPVVICRGQTVLRNATQKDVAECLGFNEMIDNTALRDVIVVGAGPAGLASAVYGASEGLDVLVLDASSPGGQAGSSSRIENYLGFPTGISGRELTDRAYTQAQKFGADVMVAATASELNGRRAPYTLRTVDGTVVSGRTVVVASGARYRRAEIRHLSDFEGVGVYSAATFIEGQLCAGQPVIVVGGGNSAGQAAVFLSRLASRVEMLVRSNSLAESMSRYLIRRIEESPKIRLRTSSELVEMVGEGHLESVLIRDNRTGSIENSDIRHVFLMIGALPNTSWLLGRVALDENGFIKTGPDLSSADLAESGWPLTRAPRLLETSLPGVFAVGDVRSGSIKRVASAVGEGSIAISFVHQTLRE